MAGAQHQWLFPNTYAASNLSAYVPVKAGASNGQVILSTANTDDVIGLTYATVATFGTDAQIVYFGVAKAIAATTIAYGARVAVGSTNGALGPLTPSGVGSILGVTQAPRYSLGRALTAAAAGDVFSVILERAEIF